MQMEKLTNTMQRMIIQYTILFILMLALTTSTCIAGDRVFMKGNQWISGGTGDQLTDFDMIRLSSYKSMNDFKTVTNTLNRKLMIGVSANHLFPPETEYAGETLADYDLGTGYLKH